MKPIQVEVLHSDCPNISGSTFFKFAEFEDLAVIAANMPIGLNKDRCLDLEVKFENGDKYACHVHFQPGEHFNLTDYFQDQRSIVQDEVDKGEDLGPLLAFLKEITLPLH